MIPLTEELSLWYLYKDAVISHFNTLKDNSSEGPKQIYKGVLSIGYGMLSIAFGIILILMLVTSPIWIPAKHLRRAHKAKSVLDKDSKIIESNK